MSKYTRRSHSPPGQCNIAGQRHGVPGRREDGADLPFPNKPVSLRRPPNPGRQGSFHLHDLKKMTLTKQPRGSLSPQEHHSDDTRNDTSSGNLQMARAIHAKQLILQEKLWSLEEKIRQKSQRDATACDNQKSEEQRPNRGRAERGNTQTKSRLSEQQRRESVRGQEMMQERGQEALKLLKKTQDQRNEDRMRDTHEEERVRGKRRETEVSHSDDERDAPQRSQQKTYKAATENYRGAGGTLSEGSPLPPPASHPSHSSGPEEGDLGQEAGTDTGLQLLPCTVCNRKFTRDRLEKHVQICKKFKQSHRPVFNSYVNRTKGSAIEEFWKTHSRSPEVLKKKNQRQNHKVNTSNLHKGGLPAGTSQPK